ncbi:MAG: S-methyl-5'-thioadenosine phosphorylase [Negativicutes bacterium]
MNNSPTIAIIGGTGVYNPGMLDQISTLTVETPYGAITCQTGAYAGKRVAFIPRHGSRHSIPPHLINYRANIWALKKLGVRQILATTAVGSLNPEMKPGDFVLPDQFIDFTKQRVSTFYEGGERGVVHVDVTSPYCSKLQHKVAELARKLNLPVHDGGCYVCTEGPRFETAAEIKAFKLLGGDVVGMTGVPEAVLAREAEMCYVTVSMVTNFAAGISAESLTHHEVLDTMKQNSANIRSLLDQAIETAGVDDDECSCQHALREFGGFTL